MTKDNRRNLALDDELQKRLLIEANGNTKKVPEIIRSILEEYFAMGSTGKDITSRLASLEQKQEATRLILEELMDEISYVKGRAMISSTKNKTEDQIHHEEKAIQQHQRDRRLELLRIWEGK